MLKRKGKLNTIYLSDTLQKQLQGICEYPLTSVVAPMAYGKTTAINWFLDKCAKTPGTKVLRISVYSDALPIFWQSIQIAFAHAGLDLLKGYDCPSDPAGAALILDDLCRELAGPDECYIFVDDFHLLRSRPMAELLCSADGTKVLSTATNQANGSFSFDPLAVDAEGTYTYTVREKNTGAARVTYDQTVYTVTVKVVNKNGQLTAEVALPDGGLTFTNTYTPEPTPTPTPTPSATPKPDHKAKPKQTPAPASTAQPAAVAQSSPRTGDNASLMTWVGLLLVCGTALAGLYVYKKRKQK